MSLPLQVAARGGAGPGQALEGHGVGHRLGAGPHEEVLQDVVEGREPHEGEGPVGHLPEGRVRGVRLGGQGGGARRGVTRTRPVTHCAADTGRFC